jgi:hypothetical protein
MVQPRFTMLHISLAFSCELHSHVSLYYILSMPYDIYDKL